jgi:hypothetical protein
MEKHGQIKPFDQQARERAAATGGQAGLSQDIAIPKTTQFTNPQTNQPITIGSKLDELYCRVDELESAINELNNKLQPLIPNVPQVGNDIGGQVADIDPPSCEVITQVQMLWNKLNVLTGVVRQLNLDVQV